MSFYSKTVQCLAAIICATLVAGCSTTALNVAPDDTTVNARLNELERKVARLQELEDLQAIRDQYARYARSGDWQDEQLRLDMIWPDAEWEHGSWTGVGGKEWIEKIWPFTKTYFSNLLHYITNYSVMLTSPTTAMAESYFLQFGEFKTPVERDGKMFRTWMVTGGKYEDRFEKRDGVWKVIKHNMILDLKTSFEVEEGKGDNGDTPADGRDVDKNSPLYWYFKLKEKTIES